MTELIGRRIRELREIRSLTVTDLARLTGLSEWALRRIEAGLENPTSRMLLRLADELGVSPVRFFEEDCERSYRVTIVPSRTR